MKSTFGRIMLSFTLSSVMLLSAAVAQAQGVISRPGARQVAGGASLSGLRTALSAFAMDMGRMPRSSEGLNALIVRPPGAKNWRGPYISVTNPRAPFTDPWGNQYRLVQQPAGRTTLSYIYSDGPDRVPGTRDDLSIQF